MDETLSRSEKKRRAKGIEQMARELTSLPETVIRSLPCDGFLQEEMVRTKTLKGGAQKRLVKHIAKELRQTDPEPLLNFLEKKKGSRLKRNREFHELETMRDSILTEAIQDTKKAQADDERLDITTWRSQTIEFAAERFHNLDTAALKRSALRYAVTRKPAQSREVFRALKAALERTQFMNQKEEEGGIQNRKN